MKRYAGIFLAAAAYGMWGLLVVFWKALGSVPAYEILAHRIVWSFVAVGVAHYLLRRAGPLRSLFSSRQTVSKYVLSSFLLGVNWFTYVWAINADYVLQCSLGYFINPLVTVVLGVVFLRERLRIGQGTAVAIALAGVLYLTVDYGHFPWIAIVLAGTFALYSLLRKIGSLGSLEGLLFETGLLFVPAFVFLAVGEVRGSSSFLEAQPLLQILLMLAGPLTAIPLILFVSAAKRVSLSTLGIMQYIAPTLTFILAVFVYDEPFTSAHLVAFSAIWTALLVYTVDSLAGQGYTWRFGPGAYAAVPEAAGSKSGVFKD